MRHILGLDLTNVVSFKKLSVDFDKNLTYVRGCNLDADPANPTGNGVGKTLMFSAIANLRFQSTPLALKKRAKKDILRQRGSTIGMIVKESADGPEFEILQTPKGYTIFKDGVDLELRTVPLAEEFIRKLLPMSETKFYSTCYLSTQRPYVLQRDTDSNRLAHIADIFNLDQYSGIRDVLATKLRSLKDDELKMSVLTQHLVGLRKKLKDLKSDTTKQQYLDAKKAYQESVEYLESLQAEVFGLTTRQRDLESLLSIERKLDSLRESYTFKERPASMLKALKAWRTEAMLWDRWSQRNHQAQAMLKKIERKLAEMQEPELSSKELTAKKVTLEKSISSLEAEISDITSVKKKRSSMLAKVDELTSDYGELNIEGKIPKGDHESDLAVARSTLKLEALLKHEHDGEFSCPTCLTDLDLTTIKHTVANAKKRIRLLESYVEGARIKAELRKIEADLPEVDTDRLDELSALLERKTKNLSSLEKKIEAAEAYASLLDQKNEIEIPEAPECKEPKYSVSEIDEHLELCQSIVDAIGQKELLLSNHEDLSDLRTESQVEKALAKVAASLDSLNSKLMAHKLEQSKSASTVSAYEQYRNTGKVYHNELVDIQAKIDALSPGLENKKILEILLKAYGTKGLRAQAAESACQLLQTNLNHYRDLIFAEAFTFEVIASDSGVSILVDRNNGKPDAVSDVRNLSGAESNSFQLLCLISLLPLLPDTDRLNIVVLDEPTSHMDPVSRAIFNERFIPVLREVVPSIYIVTPHTDDACANSNEWVVKKHKGVSTLITS